MDLDAYLKNLPGRSGELVRRVQGWWNDMYQRRREGWELSLLLASPFGVRRVVHMVAQGPDLVSINVTDTEKDAYDLLLLPPEQCSFLFRHYLPSKLDESRIIVGFGPPQNHNEEKA